MTVFLVNAFCYRQTEDSQFSHFVGGWEMLCCLVRENWDKRTPGYKDGVVTVPVPVEGFFSGVVHLTPESEIVGKFAPRREGEAPYLQVQAKGSKARAKHVEVVLYRRDVLGDDYTRAQDIRHMVVGHGDSDHWEIVSINARDTEAPEPQTPVAMARNMLGLDGGTPAEYTAKDFAEAIVYWQSRAHAAPTE